MFFKMNRFLYILSIWNDKWTFINIWCCSESTLYIYIDEDWLYFRQHCDISTWKTYLRHILSFLKVWSVHLITCCENDFSNFAREVLNTLYMTLDIFPSWELGTLLYFVSETWKFLFLIQNYSPSDRIVDCNSSTQKSFHSSYVPSFCQSVHS